MGILNFTQPVMGNWLVQMISWLVGICGSVALGVILFTVILKLVTLPFDYFSRASMRKNTLKMEEMRPELEKLQRQYADNKQLYNQKMMALYKKNGYSMFGACLPTILTLVIFIVAINAFTNYSKFQNKTYFYNMSNSYNNVIYAGFDVDDEARYIYRDEIGKIIVNCDAIIQADTNNDGKLDEVDGFNNEKFDIEYIEEKVVEGENVYYRFTLTTTNSYMTYVRSYQKGDDGQDIGVVEKFEVREEILLNNTVLATEENNSLMIKIDGANKTFAEAKEIDAEKWTADKFILDICQEKSAETYIEEKQGFLWVKNIWETDSPMAHPIKSDWNEFKNTHGYDGADIEEGYKNLIAKLEKEKTEPNGYFILIVLTALSSLVLQLVTAKTSKAQMELQTVDGQGMQTQKMMQWMMPIMMAFFAFMYTAAFSLYIIINSLLSLVMTFGINLIVDRKFKKQQKSQKPQEVRGRVYTPKKEVQVQKKEKKKKEKKDDKFAHETGGDFLTGKVKKK